MPIVKWPIPIIGKLADNQPIIGALLLKSRLYSLALEFMF